METYESEFDDNLELARSLLASNEDTADLWEANELANRALRLRPDNAEAWILKAQVMSALDDDIAALAAIELAARLGPGMAEVHYWRAAILVDLERYPDALHSIQTAFTRLRRADEWLLEDLFHEKAGILEALGEPEAALATFRQGLQRCPDSSLLKAAIIPLQRERIRARFKVIQGGLP
jgi:tetratricopeptide (TPR) repeat protein